MTNSLVIGIGNVQRGDDAAGLLVVRRVRELAPELHVEEVAAEPLDMMECWEGVKRVVLIDAVVSGSPVGTVHRFEPLRQPLPARLFRCSTHTFSVSEAIELARALDRLPSEMVLYGIEGGAFGVGDGISLPLSEAVEETARRVIEEVRADA